MSADAMKSEGYALFESGQLARALDRFEAAAAAYAAAGDLAGEAESLNNVGVIHRLQKRHDAALTALTAAGERFGRLGDNNRQAQALANLGDLYAARRDRTQAARCYSDAAALLAHTEDRARQSQVLRALSLMRLRQGRLVEAMMRMEESLSVRLRLGPGPWLFRALLRFALRLMGAR